MIRSLRRFAAACALLLAASPAAAQFSVSQFNPATGGGTAYTPPAPAYAPGFWFSPPGYVTQNGAASQLAAGYIEFLPVVIYRAVTVSDLGLFIQTAAASGAVQLSVYANSATNLPTGPALGGCSAAVTVTGPASCSISAGTGTNPVLTPGIYWLAAEPNTAAGGTVVANAESNSTGSASMIGSTIINNAISNGSSARTAYYAHTFAAGTYQDMTSVTATSAIASVPFVVFKVSALN